MDDEITIKTQELRELIKAKIDLLRKRKAEIENEFEDLGEEISELEYRFNSLD